MRVDEDMLFDLVNAVHADDLAKAKEVLSLMRASAQESLAGLLMRARAAVHPLPPAEVMSEPFILPVPGHAPGSTARHPIRKTDAA